MDPILLVGFAFLGWIATTSAVYVGALGALRAFHDGDPVEEE